MELKEAVDYLLSFDKESVGSVDIAIEVKVYVDKIHVTPPDSTWNHTSLLQQVSPRKW